MNSITLTLAQAVTMYEDHFKIEMNPELPYQDAAKMVLDEVGQAEFSRRLSYLTDTGNWIKDDPGRRAKRAQKTNLETTRGNAPECPKCGNWNAMLDGALAQDNYRRFFQCRDCDHKVFKDSAIIILKEADEPGMGADTTYHEVKRIDGEKF